MLQVKSDVNVNEFSSETESLHNIFNKSICVCVLACMHECIFTCVCVNVGLYAGMWPHGSSLHSWLAEIRNGQTTGRGFGR